MAKRRNKGNARVDRAAEAVGHTLGTIAGTIESLQAQHPHPVEEARKALTKTATRATAIAKKAKAAARRTRKVAMEKVVKPARKAVASGRKNITRTARRLKR